MTTSQETTAAAATLERRGHVGIITLNRPQAMNAVNAALSAAVGAALEEIAADPELRVGVITGAGRAFCAGADLKELAAGRPVSAEGNEEWGFAGLVQHPIDKPLIAAVNGFALGGGTEIVLACDLVVAAEEARLGLPEVKRGLMAAAGGVFRMARQVPAKVAAELLYTGEPMTAQTALEWGLVNRVVPGEHVLASALELAESIAANAPLSVQSTKRLLRESHAYGSDLDPQLWALNNKEMGNLFASEDAKEGPRAFAEKRAARWTGR
ncbi:crotonase/enoyl-CoA hydratase family protein [Streptomyces sp. NPDC047453]|uniref:crotonase/enoyl-CoA hydratase family protein n=1 Tax=Streptomyces sp. NPDC047453 TaxID=3154812 RepID=UPI0033E66A33